MLRARPFALGLAVALGLGAAACTSPEATRMRAGGPGADPGNRGRVVRMHEGSRPYWRTPRRVASDQQGPLAPARQADRLSRGGQSEPAASPAPR
ncbi:MAG TPA: hypothetical protein VFL90_21950 [Methylomirabilota bacterium]|nr:hypothetical protein [Methylomirabilota bacterium]